MISVEFGKPIGMILEEVEENEAKGVFVLEIAEEGAAAESEYKDTLPGLKVLSVMGEDVTTSTFDDVMEKLIAAPSPVSLQFSGNGESQPQGLEVGTRVVLKVIDDGQEKLLDAKVGDNLRQVLLDNNIEVYKGLKKKLGNCGGGGQCTFCAVNFIDGEDWEPRSEYEDNKLRKKPAARLSCLNNIQASATIQTDA